MATDVPKHQLQLLPQLRQLQMRQPQPTPRYVVETITMTTVTERRIVREATTTTTATAICPSSCSGANDASAAAACTNARPTSRIPIGPASATAVAVVADHAKLIHSSIKTVPKTPTKASSSTINTTTTTTTISTQPINTTIPTHTSAIKTASAAVSLKSGDEAAAAANTKPEIDRSVYLTTSIAETAPPVPAKMSTAEKISGILKGGRLWKNEVRTLLQYCKICIIILNFFVPESVGRIEQYHIRR